MIRLAIEAVLILAGAGFGWFAKGKWGSKADAVVSAVDNAVK